MFVQALLRRAIPTVAVFSFAASALAAPTGLINIDFNHESSATASGAAVIGSTGDIWNGVTGKTGSGISLVDSGGNPTGAMLDFAAPSDSNGGTWNLSGASSNLVVPDLMNDYLLAAFGHSGTITLSGLSSSTPYDLYIYSQGDSNNRITSLSVTGASVETGSNVNTRAGAAGSFVAGDNYSVFSITPDANGVILIRFWGTGTDSRTEGDINGIQITAIPEPASLSLVALGGLVFLRRRRCGV